MEKHTLKQNREAIFREEGEEGILFNPDTADIVILNETACFIWRLCDGRHTLEGIVDELTGCYEAEKNTIGKDADAFISELEKRGFVRKERAASA